MVIDYTNVNTENSSVCVYVRARPPDQGWTLEDDDASIEDKFQNPLQATLAGVALTHEHPLTTGKNVGRRESARRIVSRVTGRDTECIGVRM